MQLSSESHLMTLCHSLEPLRKPDGLISVAHPHVDSLGTQIGEEARLRDVHRHSAILTAMRGGLHLSTKHVSDHLCK